MSDVEPVAWGLLLGLLCQVLVVAVVVGVGLYFIIFMAVRGVVNGMATPIRGRRE